jgi:hypothetical protein
LTDEVFTALRETDYVILLVSENATRSAWVKFEVDAFISSGLGIARRFRILPARLDEVHPPDAFSLLANMKWADFRHDFDRGMKDLLAALKNAVKIPPEYESRLDLAVDPLPLSKSAPGLLSLNGPLLGKKKTVHFSK